MAKKVKKSNNFRPDSRVVVDLWMVRVRERLIKALTEDFGEPNDRGMYEVFLTSETKLIPKDIWEHDTITQSDVLDYLIPKMFGASIDFIYYDLTCRYCEKIVETHPQKHIVRGRLVAGGLTPEDIILDHLYINTQIDVDIHEHLRRSNIEIIGEETRPWHVKPKNVF